MKKTVALAVLISLFLGPAYCWPWTVRLLWDPPTTNADGTVLDDLKGYRAYWGLSSRNYGFSMDVVACAACPSPSGSISETLCLGSLPSGMIFFAVTALDISRNESAYSNEVSKAGPPAPSLLGNIDTVSPGSQNRVDGYDLISLSYLFGASVLGACTDAQWSAWKEKEVADLNGDGKIDADDLVILASNFGVTVSQ